MARSTFSITLLLSCVLIALSVVFQLVHAEPTTDEKPSTTLTVYHLKDGNYIKRGEIVGLPGIPEYVPTNNEIVEFRSERDAFYQIKLKDERTGEILLQSAKMCQMVASNWSDEFVLYLDEDNQFYHFSYFAGSNECEENIKYPIITRPFTTSIKVKTPVKGPKPLIGNFATQKNAQSNSKKPTIKVNDEMPENKEIEEKTFFQKYWYLILGGVLMLMTAGGAPPEGARR